MKSAFADRLRRLRRAMRCRKVAGFLVTDPVDVGYLSGFTGQDSWLLVGGHGGCLITDGRYVEQARRECRGLSVLARRGSLPEALGNPLRRWRIRRMGFEPEDVTVALHSHLSRYRKGTRLVPVAGMVGTLRICKDVLEQRGIRRAIRVAEEAWSAFRRTIRPGWTERRLAAELDYRMRLAGADAPAFPTICAVDASASMPHAQPGSRRLQRGSILLVDFGARVGDYVCDLTRVLFVGRISPCARRVYEAVERAQAAAIARAAPGVAFREVDAAARAVIQEAGFGKAFLHGTGHGIGREVHEPPSLGPRSEDGSLQPGMVVTIEPGVYRKGKFGIRIEDVVLVTEAGRRVLSRVEKDLEAMVV